VTWKKTSLMALAGCAATGAVVALVVARTHSAPTVLSGLVVTDEVVVAPAVAGRVVALHVREGDLVRRGEALAELEPAELEADRAYYAGSAAASSAEVAQRTATLRAALAETAARVRQAAAGLAAAEGARAAAAAELEEARATAARAERLADAGAATEGDRDHARRAHEVAQARLAAAGAQLEAQRAALALARAGGAQTAAQRAAVEGARQEEAAAEAQRTRAEVRLGYARLTAPVDGVVDVRAARLGEVVGVGQPVLTLVDPDALWIRVDVEETLLARLRVGDRLRVRLSSGEEREGTVFHRAAVAGFATQRDVDRSRRDIRTFEVRLRVDNRDRHLALGATAQVLVPVEG